MNKIIGAVSVLSMAIALVFAQSTPTFAQVIINNVLSPFTGIQVGPGHRYGGPGNYDSSGYYGGTGYYGDRGYYGGRSNYGDRSNYGSRGNYGDSGYYGDRRGHCWVTTDRDRNYGYWGRCR